MVMGWWGLQIDGGLVRSGCGGNDIRQSSAQGKGRSPARWRWRLMNVELNGSGCSEGWIPACAGMTRYGFGWLFLGFG